MIYPEEATQFCANQENLRKFSEIIPSEDALISLIKKLVVNLDFNQNSIFRFSYIHPNAKPAVELAITLKIQDADTKIYDYWMSNTLIPEASCLSTRTACGLTSYKLTYFNTREMPAYQKKIHELRLEYIAKVTNADVKGKSVAELLKEQFEYVSTSNCEDDCECCVGEKLRLGEAYEKFTKKMAEYVKLHLQIEYVHLLEQESRIFFSEKHHFLTNSLSRHLDNEIKKSLSCRISSSTKHIKNVQKWNGAYHPYSFGML